MELEPLIKELKNEVKRLLDAGKLDPDTSTLVGRGGILLTINETKTLIDAIESKPKTESVLDTRPRYSSVEDEELFTRYFSSVMSGVPTVDNLPETFRESVSSAVMVVDLMIEEHRKRFSKRNSEPLPPPQVKKPIGTIQ